jgi:protein involved in polysaccharide export with SLBB domain
MDIKKIILLIFLTIGLVFTKQVKAQSINQQNFSTVKVDDLSEDQIRQIIKQIQSSGLPESQLEQIATAKGMSATEVQKLRARVNALNKNEIKSKKENNSADREVLLVETGKQDSTEQKFIKSNIFGKDLFTNAASSFEPNLRLATPLNYIIGTGDQLLIDIYGYSEASYQLTVSPEGSINIPYAGIIQIGGLTVEAAKAKIKSKLIPIYSGLTSGNTKLSIAIGNIRSIKVILTGEVTKPGTYTLPSLATLFNALYSSGGPTDNGSFRDIEVVRNGKKIATLDVYDFLLKGDLKNNIRLQDQDIIRIPVYSKRVEIVGEVKRPFIFEMKDQENLQTLLNFAGGFTEKAYQARLKVLKNTPTERKINDLIANQFQTYIPQSGDKYFVSEILDRFENRVSIEGSVFRPGEYQLEKGLSLKKLIEKAEGLKEDAFLNRGYITRLLPDLNTELLAFDVKKVLNGQAEDILLQREDQVSISSIFDLKEEYSIQINGEIRFPNTYPFAENMSLQELIIKAGGFKESATSQRIEIARRAKNSDPKVKTAQSAEIFQIDIDQNLNTEGKAFILKPFDIVTVRSSTGYEIQKQVKIEGEVLFPGYYTISKKNERLSDLVQRAGGLTALAFTEGASLKRSGAFESDLEKEKENRKIEQFQKIQKGLADSSAVNIEDVAIRNNFVGINLSQVMQKPGSSKDIFLEDGDILNIPKELQTVKVSGEVLTPSIVIFNKHHSFKNYVNSAGGFGLKAAKKNAYIIYANGSVKTINKFLFFKNYPTVKTGSEIFVPKTAEKNKLSTAESVSVLTAIASLSVVIITLVNLVK